MKTVPMVLLCVFLLSGCMTINKSTGTPIEKTAVEQIQKGVTTRSDILRLFGAPSRILSNSGSFDMSITNTATGGEIKSQNVSAPDAQEIYIYEYVLTTGYKGGYIVYQDNSNTKKDTLMVWIDKKTGLVQNHAFTKQTEDKKK